MIKLTASSLRVFAWSLSSAVTLLAVYVWWNGYAGSISSVYQVFPLFGLLAFSLMWSHYIVAAKRLYFGIEAKETKVYFEITSAVVLAAILLHPGLLMWQLWRDGLGLPPVSYIQFYGEGLLLPLMFGSISLTIFLVYELRRKFKDRSWWKFVQYANDGAMILIFIHGLKLGSQLQSSWFVYVWYFYGVTLIASIAYMYGQKILKNSKKLKKA